MWWWVHASYTEPKIVLIDQVKKAGGSGRYPKELADKDNVYSALEVLVDDLTKNFRGALNGTYYLRNTIF